MLLPLFALFISLIVGGVAHAGTATLTWNVYTPTADFKEFRLFRSNQDCALAGPLQQLSATIPKPLSGSLPTSFTDTTVPNIDGTVCYELAAVDMTGNVSARSNRASKLVNLDPPPVPQNLQVLSVLP